jgi:hypothetical protein
MRQYAFWLGRLRDPGLFPNDLIADYYQSVTPPGYQALYWVTSWFVEPLAASKLLPPLLGLLLALFTYLFVRRLCHLAACALLASVLVSWYFWQYEDLVSATPRSLAPPFLAAILWALSVDRWMLGAGLIALAGACYPAGGVLGLGLLATRLVERRGWRPILTRQRALWLASGLAAAALGALLLPARSPAPRTVRSSRWSRLGRCQSSASKASCLSFRTIASPSGRATSQASTFVHVMRYSLVCPSSSSTWPCQRSCRWCSSCAAG